MTDVFAKDAESFRKDVNVFISVQCALHLLKPLLEKCRSTHCNDVNDDCIAIAEAWNALLDSRTHVVNSMMKRDTVNFADGIADFIRHE